MKVELTDIPRYYTAVAEWLGCIITIGMMPKRFSVKKFILISIIFLVLQIILLESTKNVPLWLWLPCMLLAVAMMYSFIYISSDANLRQVGYCCMHGFIWAEFTASFEWQLYYYFILDRGYDCFWLGIFFLVVMDGILAIITGMINKKIFHGEVMKLSKYELFSAVMITVLVFAFSNISFLYPDTPFSAQIEHDIFWTRTLVDLCGLVIMYMYHMSRLEMRMEHEVNAIRNALDMQYHQYKQYKESIEVINYKYHDLKHQIQGLRTQMSQEERDKWLDEMEHDLLIYESNVQTGNAVLDTLLTGKNMYCQQHNIELTSVVDGTLLKFMNSRDLCSIFGNALDNAIESVSKLNNSEERLIHLTVSSKKGFVLILFENYCKVPPSFVKGMPKTTKKDSKNHGFGLKSIQYTVKKYNGMVKVDYKKNWFELKILIPMEQETQSRDFVIE
ncbi:MAG: ATP-binding protein [Lachnospiraceae bacterium]